MGLFSDAAMYGADTTELQAGGTSFLQDVGDAFNYGLGAAVISGLGSIYNTAASGANMLGANIEEIDTYKTLDNLDKNWSAYYEKNQNVIDVAGFIGTSLIPGTIAVKALNAARAGMAGNAVGRALGFARSRQVANLDAALAELATEGGSVFTRINKNKLAAMGWGLADQTLNAAAFETGVALTMKQSPLLADDSWWDIGKSAMVGAAFGGIIGGGIDAIILNKDFRRAIQGLDATQRKYDYFPTYDKLAIDAGDRAFGIADSLLALPKAVVESDKFLDLSFHLASGTVTKKISTEKVLSEALNDTSRKGFIEFETALRELSPNADVTSPFAYKILQDFRNQMASGKSSAMIRDDIGTQLWELKGLKAASESPKIAADDLFYFNKALTKEQIDSIQTLDDYRQLVASTTPFKDNAYSKPYVFIGDASAREAAFKTAARITGDKETGFLNLSDAWKAGKHVAIQSDGTIRVTDASPYWRRVEDPVYKAERYFNTRTGAITEDAVLTAADRMPGGKTLTIGNDVVYGMDKSGKQIAYSMKTFNPDAGVEAITARHAWASKLRDDQLPDTIDVTDFSLMDRLRQVNDFERLDLITLTSGGKELGTAAELSVKDTIRSAKLSEAQRRLADAHEAGKSLDTRELALILNVEPKWLEQTVATRFRDNLAGRLEYPGGQTVNLEDGITAPLERYLSRETVIAEYARPQQFQELNAIDPKMTFQEKRLLIQDSVNSTGGQFVTGELAWMYRVQESIRKTREAAAAVLGSEKTSQLMDLTQDAARLADSTGVGATTFGFSNADYGDVLRMWSQNTGKQTHLWVQEATNEVMDALNTTVAKLRNSPKDAAEVGVLTNLLRSSDQKFVWHPDGSNKWMDKTLLKFANDPAKLESAIQELADAGKRPIVELGSEDAAQFFKTHTGLNRNRIGKRQVLANARGMTSNLDGDVIYAPPIDTTYFKHFAFVRGIDGKAFGDSEVQMIFGRDAAELSKRIASVDKNNFQVITKDETEKFFKAKGDYDFDLTINEPRINSELKRSGALSNFQPEVRPENILEDYIRWHQNQAGRLVRDAVETHYAQQISELRRLGSDYTELATSQFAGRASKNSAINPYDDYVKTALDVSRRSEYTFLSQANEFVDALGTRAYQALQATFGDASKGIVSWQEANAISERYGIKGPYSGAADFFVANTPRDRNLVKEYVAKANMLLANFVLRFDFANSLMNVISTPLMLGTELASITNLAKTSPELLGKLSELTNIKIPGQEAGVPGMGKLVGGAIKNFFGSDKEMLIARYRANGDIKDTVSQYHSMMDSLALRADFKTFSTGVDKAFEKVADLTANNWAEQFTRFVSADVMRQLTDPLVEAGKLTVKEQNAYISAFTNRVQGNYITSQRPIVFQGVLGSAVSLFQTYSFNLLQNLLRHVENGDKRALLTMGGLQTGLFGLNGTPLFEAVNTHLIGNAAINQGHHDAYSLAPQLLGKEVGDWLMYGTASAFPAWSDKVPALYTRGDINPRHMSILPLNPLQVPAVDASIRVVSNLMDVGSKLVQGANLGPTLLQGLEHNGVNRPLAGMAQLLAGQSTTSKGSLISASSDFSMITTASRLLGAKPMDEAVALNNMYRMNAYKAADRDRMEFLGEKVKSYLGKGQFPPDEVMDGFMKDYAAAGGRVENFNATLQRWARDANSSVVEKMRAKLKSSYGQRLNEIMGGEPLEDWANQQGNSEQSLGQE